MVVIVGIVVGSGSIRGVKPVARLVNTPLWCTNGLVLIGETHTDPITH